MGILSGMLILMNMCHYGLDVIWRKSVVECDNNKCVYIRVCVGPYMKTCNLYRDKLILAISVTALVKNDIYRRRSEFNCRT